MNYFSNGLWCVMKSGFYMTTKNDQLVELRRSSKALPRAIFVPKKESWSLFGSLLLLCSTTVFRISVKPLHLRSMLNKSMRCNENSNACSLHWSTEWAQFFSKTTSDCTSYNQHFKSWTNWAMKFCLISHIHLTSRQLATTSSSISTTFCRQNVSTTSRRQKMLSKNPP